MHRADSFLKMALSVSRKPQGLAQRGWLPHGTGPWSVGLLPTDFRCFFFHLRTGRQHFHSEKWPNRS